MLLRELFEDYYRPLRLRGRSANTNRLYECTIRAFSRWLSSEPTIDDLTDLTLARYLEHRASTRSPYTAEKERSQLCSLWRFAADRRIVQDRPCVPPAPLPERLPQAWTTDQLASLWKAAASTRGHVGEIPAGIWYLALISVLWESAERVGAILACRPADFSPPYLVVRAEYRKGGKRDKAHRLSPTTCDLVARATGKERLFDWPFGYAYLWHKYKRIVARAGLPSGRNSGFHQLRRSAASHYTAAGGDAVKLLDHSSPRITYRWYLDPRMTDRDPPPCDILPAIPGASGE
jgi:integrase